MESGMFMLRNRNGQLMRLASSDGSTTKKDLITWLVKGGGGEPTVFTGNEEVLETVDTKEVEIIDVEFNPLNGWIPKNNIVN